MADGTVGNRPSADNTAGSFVPTVGQDEPQPTDSFAYTGGTYGNYPNAGMAEAAAAVASALAGSEAANGESQAEAREFIVQSGAAVDGAHSPVNPAPGQVLTAGTPGIVDAGID